MIKKTLYILSLLACLLCGVDSVAQQKVGRWSIFSTVGEFSDVIEADGLTYLHSGPSLFSISDDGTESFAFNSANKLSDASRITGIWYNAEGRYLFVAYENGNIDLVYDNGDVVNMAEIKDAILATGHGINDVAFGHGRIFVGTVFGLVVYDEKKHQVIESGIYNQSVDHVFVLGNELAIATNHELLSAPYDIRHNQLSKFVSRASLWSKYAEKINDNAIAFVHVEGNSYILTLDFDKGTRTTRALNLDGGMPSRMGSYPGGAYIVHGGKISTVGADGAVTTRALPEKYAAGPAFVGNGFKSVWLTDEDGISHVDMSAESPTVLMQSFMPEGITMHNPASMRWSADGARLYLGNIGTSYFLAGAVGDNYESIARTCYITPDGSTADVQPAVVSVDNSVDFNRVQSQNGTSLMIGAPSRFAVDPDDNSIVYIPTRVGGVFVVQDGKVLNLLNSSNTPTVKSAWTEDLFLADIDQDGNLWIAEGYHVPSSIKVLPAAKRRSKIKNVEPSDWLKFNIPSAETGPNRDMFVTFCRKSNYNFISYGDYGRGFVAMDNNGTPSKFADDKFVRHTTVTDVSNSVLNTNYIICITEDADGKVWFGTDKGLFIIDDPAEAMNPNMRVRRPIVPRNDGTQLGDYLLDTEKIYSIAVDPSNRKWVTTENSGVYLVSADGTEILSHYTTANSSLPSDCVFAAAPDMNGNKVYFGTSLGAVCFDSDSSPAADDYSEVYAYPNPVRPEYTGWITIAGLMDGSLVKIADSAGNVFYQGRSEGGMVSWDGCDPSGRRVRSGVYFVFASQNTSGSSGAVTKILVIN